MYFGSFHNPDGTKGADNIGWLVAVGPLIVGLAAGVVHAVIFAKGSCEQVRKFTVAKRNCLLLLNVYTSVLSFSA